MFPLEPAGVNPGLHSATPTLTPRERSTPPGKAARRVRKLGRAAAAECTDGMGSTDGKGVHTDGRGSMDDTGSRGGRACTGSRGDRRNIGRMVPAGSTQVRPHPGAEVAPRPVLRPRAIRPLLPQGLRDLRIPGPRNHHREAGPFSSPPFRSRAGPLCSHNMLTQSDRLPAQASKGPPRLPVA